MFYMGPGSDNVKYVGHYILDKAGPKMPNNPDRPVQIEISEEAFRACVNQLLWRDGSVELCEDPEALVLMVLDAVLGVGGWSLCSSHTLQQSSPSSL